MPASVASRTGLVSTCWRAVPGSPCPTGTLQGWHTAVDAQRARNALNLQCRVSCMDLAVSEYHSVHCMNQAKEQRGPTSLETYVQAQALRKCRAARLQLTVASYSNVALLL